MGKFVLPWAILLHMPLDVVWLKISAVSTPLKLLRLGVYWTARSRHGLHPEEGL